MESPTGKRKLKTQAQLLAGKFHALHTEVCTKSSCRSTLDTSNKSVFANTSNPTKINMATYVVIKFESRIMSTTNPPNLDASIIGL